MRIIVNDNKGTNLHITIPSGLFLNRLSARFMSSKMGKYGVSMTRKQMLALIKEINRFKRHHKGWKLVEVQSADGEYVEITL